MERVSGSREHQAVRTALEQFHTEAGLQRPDLLSDRSVGDAKFVCGEPHVEVPRRRVEHAQGREGREGRHAPL